MKKPEIPPLAPLDEAQRYSVSEAERYLRLSHESVYQRIRAGLIKTITDGGRRYVPGSEIARLSRLPP
jgi:Helix-turn-helix domain